MREREQIKTAAKENDAGEEQPPRSAILRPVQREREECDGVCEVIKHGRFPGFQRSVALQDRLQAVRAECAQRDGDKAENRGKPKVERRHFHLLSSECGISQAAGGVSSTASVKALDKKRARKNNRVSTKEIPMKRMPASVRALLTLGLIWVCHLRAPAALAQPGTEAEATKLLQEFLKPGADPKTLSKQLRPTPADYAAVFEADVAKTVEAVYAPAWEAGQLVVAPKPGQTEVKVFSATSEEMKAGTGSAADFPGGWKQVAPKLKPGLTIYRFKFVEPGKDLGMAFDGLIHVNGHWRIFPKPWRALGKP